MSCALQFPSPIRFCFYLLNDHWLLPDTFPLCALEIHELPHQINYTLFSIQERKPLCLSSFRTPEGAQDQPVIRFRLRVRGKVRDGSGEKVEARALE